MSKALLPFRGTTFLGCVVDHLRVAGVDIRVVAIADDDCKILKELILGESTVVYNANDDNFGAIGSIRSTIDIVANRMVDYLLVWPVDHPNIRRESVERLITEVSSREPAVAVPSFGSRRGHPVLFAKETFFQLLSPLANGGANLVVRALPSGRILEIPVEDPAVVEDIDTPEAYNQLLKGDAMI